ncbi:MAG: hypothetical protein KF900_14435, partial [Bacteroidetes bacterium]|nr:hypothetical protein [Bacteroidota bacterium]
IFPLLLLSILYFPFAFYFFSDKNLKTQNLVLSIVGGIILSMVVNGVLFKLQYWSGHGTAQLITGIILTPVLLGVCFSMKKKADESLTQYYKNYILRISFWLALCLIFLVTPTKVLMNIQYHNEPERLELNIQQMENPNEDIQTQIDNYYKQRDSLSLAKEMGS